ncbi:MAG: hypothetical protein WC866_03165 [Patescibacteria group bacterium]
MRTITIFHKPGYVHALGLQDALYKVCNPNASEHDVIAGRAGIRVIKEDPAAPTDTPSVRIEIGGSRDPGLETLLIEATENVIRCSAPRHAVQPLVHVFYADLPAIECADQAVS